MGIGASIFLLAVGAILAWAVSVDTNGIDLNMVGVILMIVGILGLLLSLIFWSTWGRLRRLASRDRLPRGRRSLLTTAGPGLRS